MTEHEVELIAQAVVALAGALSAIATVFYRARWGRSLREDEDERR